jgi:hypothetical protein
MWLLLIMNSIGLDFQSVKLYGINHLMLPKSAHHLTCSYTFTAGTCFTALASILNFTGERFTLSICNFLVILKNS